MKQLSHFAPPLLMKATARPRRKGVILLRRVLRRLALVCAGLFVLVCLPFTNERRLSD